MKKTRILSLLLGLSLLCTLIVPATVYADDPTADSGMKISKTATANADGTYTITLEAFATGSKVITEQKTDIPTDIVLVIDQSGSMEEAIGGYTYTAYRTGGYYNSRNYHNDEYYPLKHNDGSKNLWHKLNNNEYVAVSVEQKMVYTAISGWSNRKYYDNQNSLYCLVSGEYKSVSVVRDGHLFSADEYWYTVDDRQILYTTGDESVPNFGQYAPLYQSKKKYTYSYTLNGVTTVIEESFGDGSSPDTQFYRRDYSSSAGDTRLNALKNAATTFANAVAAKAAGADGDINTPADNVNHRIAVVGFASGKRYNGTNYNYNNTEVFVGSNQYRYGTAAQGQYGNAFQDMNTSTGVSNVSASIGVLSADGGTLTNLGLEMGNGIFGANPIAEGEKRNRVVIVFSDGVPGWSGYDSDTANSAITQAGTAKNTYGATVYTIGIFPGANATSAGNQNGNETEKANWFMQQVSSNNGTPRTPSYYLSAGDAASLNSIFQQISDQIETGGSSSTLTSDAVVKDIISPQFTLPEGANVSSITLKTYRCTGKNGSDYTWSKNTDAMGAKASISGDQVNVTGFNFSENYVGTVTENGSISYRGHKLVISFKVRPKAGFLGGNGVITNASAGIYENSSAQTPVMTFEQPKVNVPIQDVTVTAEDKNVYLLGGVTADQLKNGATVKVGDVTLDLSKAGQNYGLEPWQTAYVDITVGVKGKDGTVVSDKLEALKEDTTYTVEVTVTPKTAGLTDSAGTPATVKTGQNNPAKINVFKPELTFKDSQIDLGDTANYKNNKADTDFEVWKHQDAVADSATMIGTKPELALSYDPEEFAFTQDTPVKVTVKIDDNDVNTYTTFKHDPCNFVGCKWNDLYAEGKSEHGKAHFIVHVKSFDLTIKKTGTQDIDENQSFVFEVKKDDGSTFSMDVVIQGNSSVTIKDLKPGTYTVTEETGWSWRYTPNAVSQTVNPATATAKDENGAVLVTFNNTREKIKWLNGSTWCENRWATKTVIKPNGNN